jgi:hypothetical protein
MKFEPITIICGFSIIGTTNHHGNAGTEGIHNKD